MPEVSRFYGIVIRMYFADHFPPHFHAEYGEREALIGIEGLTVIAVTCQPEPSVWLRSGLCSTRRSLARCGTRLGSRSP